MVTRRCTIELLGGKRREDRRMVKQLRRVTSRNKEKSRALREQNEREKSECYRLRGLPLVVVTS